MGPPDSGVIVPIYKSGTGRAPAWSPACPKSGALVFLTCCPPRRRAILPARGKANTRS